MTTSKLQDSANSLQNSGNAIQNLGDFAGAVADFDAALDGLGATQDARSSRWMKGIRSPHLIVKGSALGLRCENLGLEV